MLFLPLVIRDSYKIMIRILHTADWHLGQTFFGYDRTEEHGVFLNWLAEEIRQKEIDALIIAGDVFDVSNPSAASQSMYYQFIYRVTAENPYLQIVIVAGNHDSAARLEAPLPLLQAMRTEVRGVVRKLEGGEIDYDHLTVELKNRKGEVELLCMAVPFLHPTPATTLPICNTRILFELSLVSVDIHTPYSYSFSMSLLSHHFNSVYCSVSFMAFCFRRG